MIGRLRERLHRLDELTNERLLGISTIEYHQQHDAERPDFRGYSPTSYRDWRIIKRQIKPHGSFIDYGAGLGRVSVLAARLSFDRVIGIDLDRNLVERGNRNISHANGLKCPVSILCQDATTFQIPADTSVLYFCNPFSGSVLAAVLENVRKSGLTPSLVCNLPNPSGFEYEMRGVPWLTLQSETALSNGRKCLTFVPQG